MSTETGNTALQHSVAIMYFSAENNEVAIAKLVEGVFPDGLVLGRYSIKGDAPNEEGKYMYGHFGFFEKRQDAEIAMEGAIKIDADYNLGGMVRYDLLMGDNPDPLETFIYPDDLASSGSLN